MANNDKVFEIVTEKFIAGLEQGFVPWHKPWKSTEAGMPRSMSTGKAYRGINVFILGFEAQSQGYNSAYWGTYTQIAERCGYVKNPDYVPFTKGSRQWILPEGDDGTPRGVRAGEKGTTIVFWKKLKVEDTSPAAKAKANGKKVYKWIFMLRYFSVFNASQCDGLPVKFFPAPVDPNAPVVAPDEAAEALVAEYLATGPSLRFGGSQACYSPSQDAIQIPDRQDFVSTSEYYSTLYHEIGHSTGHKSRLNREGIVEGHRFGDALYSAEELVAEMTAGMLSAVAGIDQSSTFDNSVAYVQNWLKVLKGDKKMIVSAGAKAQRAADLAMSVKYEVEEAAEPVLVSV